MLTLPALRKYIYILFVLCVSLPVKNLSAQWRVSGTVTDLHRKPATGISVVILKTGSGSIVGFASSDSKGRFAISVNHPFIADSFAIQINSFGYAGQQRIIHSPADTQDFILRDEASQLPGVVVKAAPKPIRAQGDTISYQVEKFSRTTDRTIGDVIKRLPGVEVDGQGKITYQGKAINRFYIDGDNLLDDKYNIATNAVPADMIATVQVLDKHQPIRALENIQYSDAPAMNIITKADARTRIVGEGNAALGLPSLHDITVNALLLKKKTKFINYLKLNNAGNDLSTEIISHNAADNASRIGYQPIRSLVGSNMASPPAIGKKRYLFNNSVLPSINDLVNLGKRTQLRINAYDFIEKQYQSFNKNTVLYFPGNEVRYSEKQDGRAASNTFRTQLNLNVNDSSYYLNNNLIIENETVNNSASTLAVYSKPPSITQSHTGNYTGLSNEFSMIRKLHNGRNAIELFSYLEHNTSPQQLSITPGLYDALLNGGNPYTSLVQSVQLPGIFTSNYITYRQMLGRMAWISQAGFSYQRQEAESGISVWQNNGTPKPAADSFVNNSSWERTRIFLQEGLEWKEERWHLQLSLPLNFQQTVFSDKSHPAGDTAARMIPFTPSATLRISSGRQNTIQLSGYFDKRLGSLSESYPGFILNDYRRFTRHSTSLPMQTSRGVSANYYFKRALEGFFVNTGFMYVRNSSNTIENTTVSNALQVSDYVYAVNPASLVSVSGSVNKYFYKKNTGIKFGFVRNWQTFRQLQNGLPMTSRNVSTVYRLRFDSRFTDKVLYDYTTSFANTVIYQDLSAAGTKTQAAKLYLMSHELNLNILFGKIMYLTCTLEDFWSKMPGSNASGYLFADATATLRLPGMRSDIQLYATNLFNHDSFRMQYISANLLSDSRYTIRPRAVMVKFHYRF